MPAPDEATEISTIILVPSLASTWLMPPFAFSGTSVMVGAPGGALFNTKLKGALGLLGLPAASVMVAITGCVPVLPNASKVVLGTVTVAVPPISTVAIV